MSSFQSRLSVINDVQRRMIGVFAIAVLAVFPCGVLLADVLEGVNGNRSGQLEFRLEQVLNESEIPLFSLGRFRLLADGRVGEQGLGGAADRDHGALDQLGSEVKGCRVGTSNIPDEAVELLLNRAKFISVQQARDSFELHLSIKVPKGAAGTLSCRYVRLLRLPSSQALLSVNLSMQLVLKPEWQDMSSRPIGDIFFDFSGVMIPGPRAAEVSSTPISVKLTHVSTLTAMIQLSLPKRCSIGSHGVASAHVRLMYNQSALPGCGCITVKPDVPIVLQLFFDQGGGYNRYHGPVACQQPGELIYTY